MLRHYRRYWALIAAALLALPLIVGAVAPGGDRVSSDEARVLAPVPALPGSFAGWLSLPKQMDAYLRDHFGLRQSLLHAYALIMSESPWGTGNASVLRGANGWLFARGNAMVEQSAGLIRRDAEVAKVADLLETMRTVLAAQGARLLVAPPPNAATIYGDELPLWARNRGRRTEYDVFLDDLAARGVAAVDLRPALRAAAATGQVYFKHDSHWTARGAVAAFNAIVRADSHADWALDPSSVLGPPTTVVGGDLARMLGIAADVTETDDPLTLPRGTRETFGAEPFSTYLATSSRPGPTIMIIGDSFTDTLFAPMLLRHTGRVVWLHYRFCRFDWKWVDQFHPDEVWWMANERYIVCRHGDHPVGFPRLVSAGRR